MKLDIKKERSEELLEKRILLLSFLAGVGFVIVELIYSVYSHSQSTLMDALYDASELIFIISTLFLTPLFHMPVSEKHPYGFFQLESFIILIKNIMLISVTFSVLTSVAETMFSGGNQVDKGQVSLFQFCLGCGKLPYPSYYETDEPQGIFAYRKRGDSRMEVGRCIQSWHVNCILYCQRTEIYASCFYLSLL